MEASGPEMFWLHLYSVEGNRDVSFILVMISLIYSVRLLLNTDVCLILLNFKHSDPDQQGISPAAIKTIM